MNMHLPLKSIIIICAELIMIYLCLVIFHFVRRKFAKVIDCEQHSLHHLIFPRFLCMTSNHLIYIQTSSELQILYILMSTKDFQSLLTIAKNLIQIIPWYNFVKLLRCIYKQFKDIFLFFLIFSCCIQTQINVICIYCRNRILQHPIYTFAHKLVLVFPNL